MRGRDYFLWSFGGSKDVQGGPTQKVYGPLCEFAKASIYFSS